MSTEQTLGQRRVRVNFNPSGSSIVDEVKQKYADIIDELENFKTVIKTTGPANETPEAFNRRAGEAMRQIAIAQTEAEGAAHWAVKALTAQV